MPFEDSCPHNLAFDICTGFIALPADKDSNIHCVKLLATAIASWFTPMSVSYHRQAVLTPSVTGALTYCCLLTGSFCA